jgi:transglutaminase/protease-like cytokinesis protein 3
MKGTTGLGPDSFVQTFLITLPNIRTMNISLVLILWFIITPSFCKAAEASTYRYHNLNQNAEIINIDPYRKETPELASLNVPDEISNGIKTAPLKYLDKLIIHLTKWTEDDYLKVKSIHDWICLNIDYDMVGYNKGDINIEEPHITLRLRRAVCGGYAALFRYMTYKAGFESTIVSGFTKGQGKYALGEQKILTQHAWNSINIKNVYYLVDVTWNAGYASNNEYIKRYSTEYFLANPNDFVRSHYPEAPGWLLLDTFVTLEDFKRIK